MSVDMADIIPRTSRKKKTWGGARSGNGRPMNSEDRQQNALLFAWRKKRTNCWPTLQSPLRKQNLITSANSSKIAKNDDSLATARNMERFNHAHWVAPCFWGIISRRGYGWFFVCFKLIFGAYRVVNSRFIGVIRFGNDPPHDWKENVSIHVWKRFKHLNA